jgi:predicted transglutaminase-like cysteine proteinase
MGSRGKSLFAALATCVVIVAGSTAAQAIDLTNSAFAQIVGPTSVPIGHSEFCKSHTGECGLNAHVSDLTVLTEERWQQLVDTNNRMNTEIVPITDEDLYKVGELWTYPDGYGDCEDYVLAKRRELINAGWEASTLLMAVVRERNGAGHAVLMVRTDRGDLVLDNQDGMVRLWNETPYQFVKRQSQANAGEWVLIDDSRTTVVTTASN